MYAIQDDDATITLIERKSGRLFCEETVFEYFPLVGDLFLKRVLILSGAVAFNAFVLSIVSNVNRDTFRTSNRTWRPLKFTNSLVLASDA